MKNKTKIIPDISQAQPFNRVIACKKCAREKAVTVYPALGPNVFECTNCTFINTVKVKEMEVCHD